jgi:hypothetical protein
LSEPNYAEIRHRVEKRFNLRAGFYGHLAAFIIINFGVWFWLQIPFIVGLFGVFTIGWFVVLVIHGINYAVGEARERAIDRAIREEREWLMHNSTASHRLSRLSQAIDHEPVGDEALHYVEKPKRERRSQREG